MDTPPPVARYGITEECNWQVCVVPNLYPVLNREVSSDDRNTDRGLFESRPANGFHEVVIESPTHASRFSDLSLDQTRMMLLAYRDRMNEYRKRDGIQYVQIIKNSGAAAGASLEHSHSQLFALPLVPEQVEQELSVCEQWYETHETCVMCELLAGELEKQARIVAMNDQFVAWCPYASRCSFETWIAPRVHAGSFEEMTNDQAEGLTSLLADVMQRIEGHPRINAYNYLLHSLPFGRPEHRSFHWHLEIIPRIAKEAGFEWSTRVFVNTVSPEAAAQELRKMQTGDTSG